MEVDSLCGHSRQSLRTTSLAPKNTSNSFLSAFEGQNNQCCFRFAKMICQIRSEHASRNTTREIRCL